MDVGNWQYSYNDIVNMASMFDEDVIAVTADEFMTLIKKNVENQTNGDLEEIPTIDNVTEFDYTDLKLYTDTTVLDLDNARIKMATDETSFTFDDTSKGTQGWTPWVRGGALDVAAYSKVSEDGEAEN